MGDEPSVESKYQPAHGRTGAPSLEEGLGLSQEFLSFLACGTLRPVLEAYFTECRSHVTDSGWSLGVCPFCGAPPGFGDVTENGQRRLLQRRISLAERA